MEASGARLRSGGGLQTHPDQGGEGARPGEEPVCSSGAVFWTSAAHDMPMTRGTTGSVRSVRDAALVHVRV